MKSFSSDSKSNILSVLIDGMATNKKMTASHRAFVWLALGSLIGGMIDVRGSLAPLAKLPLVLSTLEEHTAELKELRKLREEDHRALEEVKDILRRNKLAAGQDEKGLSTVKYSE